MLLILVVLQYMYDIPFTVGQITIPNTPFPPILKVTTKKRVIF